MRILLGFCITIVGVILFVRAVVLMASHPLTDLFGMFLVSSAGILTGLLLLRSRRPSPHRRTEPAPVPQGGTVPLATSQYLTAQPLVSPRTNWNDLQVNGRGGKSHLSGWIFVGLGASMFGFLLAPGIGAAVDVLLILGGMVLLALLPRKP